MKIDAHVHLMNGGETDILLDRIRYGLAECGFDKAVLLPDFKIPNNADVEYAMRKFPGLFYGIYIPDFRRGAAHVLKELEACLSAGFRGIKLHPRFQTIDLNADAEKATLAMCNERKLPVIIDGFMRDTDEGSKQLDFISRAADMLEETKIVIAHFGAERYKDVLMLAEDNDHIYMDLSLSLFFFTRTRPEMVGDMCSCVKRSGADRFLYGSDYPMYEIDMYARGSERKLRTAGLDDREIRKVFGETTLGVFGP